MRPAHGLGRWLGLGLWVHIAPLRMDCNTVKWKNDLFLWMCDGGKAIGICLRKGEDGDGERTGGSRCGEVFTEMLPRTLEFVFPPTHQLPAVVYLDKSKEDF